VDATVIERFLQYGRADVEHGRFERARYMARELERMHGEAIEELEAAIDGSADLPVPPRYRTARPTGEGEHFLGQRQTAGENSPAEGPLFFSGYGHFNQVREDIPHFQDFGNNAIQIQVKPPAVVTGYEDGEFQTTTRVIDNDSHKHLQRAAEHDVAVSMMVSTHQFPQWAIEHWPEIASDNPGPFLKTVIDHPKARELFEVFLRTVVREIKDYESLHSITLSNEPTYSSESDQWTQEEWAAYLRAEYADLDELNAVYDSDYDSFDAVPAGASEMDPHPRTLDWSRFNNDRFAEWHAWLAETIHDEAPDVPVHAKIMGKTLRRRRDLINWGVDPEEFARQVPGYNGNDNGATPGIDANKESSGTLLDYVAFIDLQRSLKNAPIANSENHLIPNEDAYYEPRMRRHVALGHWQGFLHGQTFVTNWIWRRVYDTDAHQGAAGSVLNRPDVVAAIGKTTLDANRLGEELVAFQDVEPSVAVCYAPTAHVYEESYAETAQRAYEALSLEGRKVGFVSEPQVADGGLDDYDLVVLPLATHVRGETGTALADPPESTTLVTIGQPPTHDGHDRELSADVRQSIADAAASIPADADRGAVRSALREHLPAASAPPARVVGTDGALGELEWRSVMHDGRLLVNVANYGSSAVEFRIERDGTTLADGQNLLAAEATTGETKQLGSRRAALFAFEVER
jgi:hypothetical protein